MVKSVVEDNKVVCIHSGSQFYTQGDTYTIVSINGDLGTVGDDGRFDMWGKTLSKFKKLYDRTKKAKSKA